jgi:hypothetical protein
MNAKTEAASRRTRPLLVAFHEFLSSVTMPPTEVAAPVNAKSVAILNDSFRMLSSFIWNDDHISEPYLRTTAWEFIPKEVRNDMNTGICKPFVKAAVVAQEGRRRVLRKGI